MNKTSYFFLIIVSILYFQHCSKENEPLIPLSEIQFWTQEEIDQYEDRLLAVDQLEGDVHILDASDLSAFRNIRFIQGQLSIRHTTLENLEDLANLERVDDLRIIANSHLTTLELKNLEEVKGNIMIAYQFSLRDINFPKLIRVGSLEDTAQLLAGIINVVDNDRLETITFTSLKNYKGLGIGRNDNFTSLNGLNLAPDPEQPLHFYRNHIEFSKMDCPSDLFQHLGNHSSFDIKIRNVEESSLEWLGNLKPGNSINLYGDLVPEDLCLLKDIISGQPFLLLVFPYDETINHSFDGFAVLDNCP